MDHLKKVACLPIQKFINDPPLFRCQRDGLIATALCGLCAALGFLKVEATDLNKCPSIMNVALKLRNRLSRKTAPAPVREPEWVDG